MKLSRGMKNAGAKKTETPAPIMKTAATAQTQTVSPAAKPAKPTGNGLRTVTIEAKIDVGFGNTLYLRGEGRGLSWDRGIPLTCVDGSTWKWTSEAEEQLKFKLLLNDSVWAQGEDLIAAPGQKVEVAPAF